MRTAGTTGHRNVDQEPGELHQFARLSVARMVVAGASEIITGMARGWDLAVARACFDLRVPYIAALPFYGQEDYWSAEEQAEYRRLVKAAVRITVAGRVKLNHFYIMRDRQIVDECDELWALDSGRPSGSHTTVLYAEQQERKVVPLWSDWLMFRDERKQHA